MLGGQSRDNDGTQAAKEFADLVAGHLSSGFFTHIYAQAGSLLTPEPTFEFSHLPDDRTIFDLSSLTKALVTTPLIFKAVAEKSLDLSWPLSRWLQDYSTEDLSPALLALTVESLLRHESGLPAWRNFFVRCGETARSVTEVLNRSAQELPNLGKSVYSDVGFIALGEALERVGGLKISSLFNSFCFDLLRFNQFEDFLRFVPGPKYSRVAVPTAVCFLRNRLLTGEVHDENCWALGGVTGHSGLFGTGPAVGKFLKALVKSETGNLLLSKNEAVLRPPPNEPLLGWRQGADLSSETFGEGRGMGHMGFTGTAFWVHPRDLRYGILLTNRVISGRVSPLTRPFRRQAFAHLWRLSEGR